MGKSPKLLCCGKADGSWFPPRGLASPQHAWHWVWSEPFPHAKAEPTTALLACVTCSAAIAYVLGGPGQCWFGTIPVGVCPQPAALQCALLQPLVGEVTKKRKDWQQDVCQLQEWLSSAQAALDSSSPSPESGNKPQLKQYRKTGKKNKPERLLFPRSHTLFVGCSEAGKAHSEGIFTAHPAWHGMLEVCELRKGECPPCRDWS